MATDQQSAGLELRISIDRDTAARMGVSVAAIDSALYDAFGQRQIGLTYGVANQYRQVMEVTPQYLENEESLKHLYVRSQTGGLVPLSALTTVSRGNLPTTINHQGQFPSVTLSFNLPPGKSLSDAVKAVQQAESEIRLPASVQGGFTGTAQAFQQSLSSQPLLIILALLAVYIVLGVLYESYVHPLTILSTLPTAGVGALLALRLTGTDLSIVAIIGIILLIGIVKKNAIMMVDFAVEAERSEGLADPRGDPQGLRAALPAHPHDHPGRPLRGAAAGAGDGPRLRAPQAPGHQRRGRPAPLAAPDALHDAGHLPVPGPVLASPPALAGRLPGAVTEPVPG